MDKLKSIEQLDALAAKICDLLEVGMDKAQDLMPEVCKQIVIADMLKASIAMIAMAILFIIARATLQYVCKLKRSQLDENAKAIFTTICVAVMLFTFSAGCFHFYFLLRAIFAPYIVVIEKLSEVAR